MMPFAQAILSVYIVVYGCGHECMSVSVRYQFADTPTHSYTTIYTNSTQCMSVSVRIPFTDTSCSKETPPPRGVSLVGGFQIKKPEEEVPP